MMFVVVPRKLLPSATSHNVAVFLYEKNCCFFTRVTKSVFLSRLNDPVIVKITKLQMMDKTRYLAFLGYQDKIFY